MAESLFSSLLHTLDKSSISGIARGLGEQESSVAQGMESSIAAVLGGLAAKSDQPGMMRRAFDLVSGLSSGLSWTQMAGDAASAGSPLIATGKRILSSLFGGSEGAIGSEIGHDSGLGSSAASALMAMAGPMVMSFLGRKVRDGDITMNNLGTMLKSETGALRNALPASVSDLIWRPATAETPVIAQAVQHETSSATWPWALALSALALGGLWLFTHGRRATESIGSVATGAASRLADEGREVGRTMKNLPSELQLKVPGSAGESRMLVFLRDTTALPDGTWFEFDQLRFDPGSAKLRDGSADQLDDIAAIFKAYPNLQARVAGHTDNIGTEQANLALSERRADEVRSELVARGVGENRLTTEGYGEKSAIADNSTEAGRATNRRVSFQVTGK